MTPEQIQQILDSIASVGGMLAQAGFELAVRKAFWDGVLTVGFSLLALVVLAVFAPKMYKSAREFDFFDPGMVQMISAGIGIFLLFIGARAVSWLIIPEWRAIELLMRLATGG